MYFYFFKLAELFHQNICFSVLKCVWLYVQVNKALFVSVKRSTIKSVTADRGKGTKHQSFALLKLIAISVK